MLPVYTYRVFYHSRDNTDKYIDIESNATTIEEVGDMLDTAGTITGVNDEVVYFGQIYRVVRVDDATVAQRQCKSLVKTRLQVRFLSVAPLLPYVLSNRSYGM